MRRVARGAAPASADGRRALARLGIGCHGFRGCRARGALLTCGTGNGRKSSADSCHCFEKTLRNLSLSALTGSIAVLLSGMTPCLAAPPDLTAGGAPASDNRTFNLGPTGMRGWTYYDMTGLKRKWLRMLDEARDLVRSLPAEDVGCFYVKEKQGPVEPDPGSKGFPQLTRHWGSVGGAWPVVRPAGDGS